MHQTLTAYNEGGETLFPSGTVEAHWYQWAGFYVVLYRGLDVEAAGPLCAGNSIQTAAGFESISNSPVPVGHDPNEVCVDVPNLASGDHGTIQCGPLVAYLTDIPTSAEGALFGTVEFNDGSGFIGHTSSIQTDVANTPEFDPEAPAYILPPSGVDGGGTVTCVEAEAATSSRADVEDFIAELAAGLREGNEAFLFPRLHPAVLERYGEDQCRTYTTPLEDPTLQLEVVDVTGPGPWTWERDDRTTNVSDVFTVAIVGRTGDTETEQELHVGVVDGELRWFTDCGDPAP